MLYLYSGLKADILYGIQALKILIGRYFGREIPLGSPRVSQPEGPSRASFEAFSERFCLTSFR